MSSRRKRSRFPPDPERVLLPATELTGLRPGRVTAARDAIEALGIPHLSRELLQPTIDAAVAATLLIDSIDTLAQRGVERSKLVSKLRNDPDVWPTWAELRAARDLTEFLEQEAEIQLEANRARGKHSDFRFTRPSGTSSASSRPKAVPQSRSNSRRSVSPMPKRASANAPTPNNPRDISQYQLGRADL